MNRKRRIVLIVVVAVLALAVGMAASKPSEAKYKRWALNQVSRKAEHKSVLMGLGISLFGARMIDEGTTMTDYGLFRVFETEIQGKRLKVAGALGMLIPLGKPEKTE
ncbi:hypothetical protein [Cohnella rhizosphaerae]|uniref:DUF4359 domain-containing protein n=1 Tax=Cohnella rhizosphaerae TaxID=1457232 RepID=A0A9X4KY62_9BACL|nr:hypothetical protein [Cohnella rhizosphaerae]MDG0813486.1 DUF4359 domain-containing protein [Cohnella rhizosphaerae]